MRCFLRFLLLRGILQRDLSQVLPRVRVPRDATIPSVWEPELVERLLKVVKTAGEASATTPSFCLHVAWDCDWAISERSG